MKRVRVDETAVKDVGGHPQQNLSSNSSYAGRGLPASIGSVHRQVLSSSSQHNTASTIAYTSSGGVKTEPPGPGVMQSTLYSNSPVSYSSGTMPSATVPHSGKPQAMQPLPISQHGQLRNKNHGGGGAGSQSPPTTAPSSAPQGPQQQSPSSCQRLKVEDALSYLDQVKYKFGNKPQVYNDFLDIMKEFKSQSIDTPGVIGRVSNLFQGHPELIVGFNTFLPSGYKIEVQANDQGYAFQVSVSMPSPNPPSVPPATGSVAHSTAGGGGTVSSGQGGKPAVLQILQGSGPIIHPNMTSGPQNMTSSGLNASAGTGGTMTPLSTNMSSGGQTAALPSHHSTASPYTSNNMVPHNNQQHHTMTQAQAAQQAVSQALSHVETGVVHHPPQNQPVEFNHAINYVNKIKNRFQGQPEKYKRFLEILHTYQKEQKILKEGHHPSGGLGPHSGNVGPGGKHLTEAEVYSQVAKLFENQEDLLAEFGQFLPDATSHQAALSGKTLSNDHSSIVKKPPVKPPYNNTNALREREHREREHRDVLNMEREREIRDRERDRHHSIAQKTGHNLGQIKRSPTYQLGQGISNLHRGADGPPSKKHKGPSIRDVTLAEAGKHGSLSDYAFFDKVRKALRSQEVYENFLRCLVLFNSEVISKSELVQLSTPFLGKFPELLKWFKEFMGHCDQSIEAIPNNVARQERPQGDNAMEIDLTTCKRLGASYCALPKNQEGRKCSGRTQLCKEVLNDQWVSFPTWSEDSTFVTSRKTQYEEYIYRCEDERFELDVVIETNASTIRVLEGVQKKLNRMSPEEVSRFRLDDCLGGQSPVIHQRALKRIYGDKAQDIIDGLKRNPAVGVQVVLRRLKAKEEEWREAQKGFNKIWREQNEKYYLKSLDHQGINFKQNDVKALRSKSLFNEIETLYDERHEQNEDGGESMIGPHLTLPYRDKTILDDAANLLIHHVKRQTGIQKNEKQRIKHILRQFVPDLFFHPRQELSDDEREGDDDKEDGDAESPARATSPAEVKLKSAGSSPSTAGKSPSRAPVDGGKSPSAGATSSVDGDDKSSINLDLVKDEDVKVPQHALSSDPEESYSLFMVNNNWYVFLRLHAILCERLTKMYERALVLAEEEVRQRSSRKESTAVALRLKPKNEYEIEDYYPAFLDMVKNVLDGNMDSNSFEDTLRDIFGIHAYIAFTLDKVVSYAVRQLQHCVTERGATSCMDLYQRELRRGAAGGLCSTAHRRLHSELAYQRKAEANLRDENCFKIYIYKKDCRMTIELLDTESEDGGAENVADAEKWSTYVERYADASVSSALDHRKSRDSHPDHSDDEKDGDVRSCTGRKAVYLSRNLRMCKAKDRGAHCFRKANSASASVSEDPAAEAAPGADKDAADDPATTGAVTASSPRGADLPDTLESLERKLAEKGLPQRVNSTSNNSGIVASDQTQCKLSSTNSKMLFIVDRENFLYKQDAFTRAKQCHPEVTKRLHNKFKSWHKQWSGTNVSDQQQKACTDWLMGRIEGVVANRTRVLTNNDLKRTPYMPYNRFKVE